MVHALCIMQISCTINKVARLLVRKANNMFGSLLLAIIAILLQLHRCGAVTSGGGRLSILFLHGRCEGEGYSTEQLRLEVAARMAAEDVSACSEYPVNLTAIGAVSKIFTNK